MAFSPQMLFVTSGVLTYLLTEAFTTLIGAELLAKQVVIHVKLIITDTKPTFNIFISCFIRTNYF